jgi:hypothetical protein
MAKLVFRALRLVSAVVRSSFVGHVPMLFRWLRTSYKAEFEDGEPKLPGVSLQRRTKLYRDQSSGAVIGMT